MQSRVTSTLRIPDKKIMIDRWLPKKGDTPPIQADGEPVYLDVRSVRNPATHARNVRYRVAASPGWKTEFEMFWDETIVGQQQMEAIINDAGSLQGLGDGRNIGFGRFEVVSFKVINDNDAKKPTTKRAVARAKA